MGENVSASGGKFGFNKPDTTKEEQKELRQKYILNVRRNLRGQLNNIDIQNEDGSVTNLGEKYGNKKLH